MFAFSARFGRAVFAGSPMKFMLALVTVCAMTLGSTAVASAGSLYESMTHSNLKIPIGPKGPKPKTPAIVTTSGPVKGFMHKNTAEFLGIPYAAPPVGSLRWMPPTPFGKWHGVLKATSFGNVCTQGGSSGVTGSEDCLFLNIYVPRFKKNSNKHHGGGLPVMFWIHGGGLTSGAGSLYDPTPLLRPENVIVVTINYRLGYLGFFAESALDAESHDAGNYGLMDQQFAMQWVQNNIAAFGGDPSNVTIFGESAGGHSVYCQLASPTAAGLFSHAIAESGSYLIFDAFIQPIVTLLVGESTGSALIPGGDSVASGLGCTTAACLRALSNADVFNVQPGTLYAFVDGTLLTQTPGEAFASGNFNKVPVIAGTNHDEWRLFVAQQYDGSGHPILTETEYNDAAIALWGPLLGPIIPSIYPYASYSSGGVALGASGTDGIFACSARNGDALLSKFTTTYAYEFNDENAPPHQSDLPGLTFPLGAFHSAELQYLFNIGFFQELDAAQLQLSAAMVSYWTNFAVSGDPNGGTLPTWSLYDPMIDQFQSLIPPTPVVESTFNTDHQCDSFWNLIP